MVHDGVDAALPPLRELAAAPRSPAEVGGKAANLGALIAAGVAVPDGFVVPAGAREHLGEEGLLARITAAAADLGAPLVVRSSSPLEDGPGRAAAGVFASRTGVTIETLDDAVRAVWSSGDTPTARAYARARGVAGTVALAVVVQRQVPGTLAVVYTRPPGDPDASGCVIETGGQAIEVSREGLAVRHGEGASDDRLPGAPTRAALVRAALAAETAIAAGETGADVELVIGDTGVTVVQARPIVHGRNLRRPPPILFAFSRGDRDTVWRWDVTHNPDPLSPAQIGLVERVEASGALDLRQRIVGGYLYYAAGSAGPAEPIEAAELARRWREELEPDLEQALAPLEGEEPVPLERALKLYSDFCARYARAGAALRGPRQLLLAHLRDAGEADPERRAAELLRGPLPAGLESLATGLESWLARTAAGEVTFESLLAYAGPLAPAWDVAVPTYGETPERLRAALERAPASTAGTLPAVPEIDSAARPLIRAARVAQALGERDDRAFARAQAGIRRILLRLADRWGLVESGDIFFLPFDEVVRAVAGDSAEPPQPEAAHRRAGAERSAQARRRQWAMPLAVCDGRADVVRRAPRGDLWAGRGTGGRAEGIVARVTDLGHIPAISPDTVLLTRTVTPAMAVAVRGAAALVAAHDGLLGHGAALARELGIPCVVDCPDVWTALEDGERVLVDADAGIVVRRRV